MGCLVHVIYFIELSFFIWKGKAQGIYYISLIKKHI